MKQINSKTAFTTLVAIIGTFAVNAQSACTQFDYFYSDINYPGNVKQSDIYSVSLSDGVATLTPIISDLAYGAHIAYSEGTGLLYLVNDANGQIRTLDPVTAELGAAISSASPMSGVTTASVSEDGKLLIGRGNGNIYEVDLSVSPYTSAIFDTGADIEGGDITFANNGLFLASKPLGNLYVVLPEMSNILLGNVNGQVTGMATSSNGETVIVSSRNNTSFLEYSLDGGVTEVASYTAMLNGAPFTLDNGDMASGCSAREIVIDTEPCYGSEILAFDQGFKTNGDMIGEDRSDETRATGAPDASNAAGGFVSLGVGGSITIGFEGAAFDGPGDDILVYETSFSGDVCGFGDDEFADVELSQDGITFVAVGTICRDGGFDIAASGLDYVVAVRITNSASTNTSDGYDVDGIVAVNGCGSIPVIVEPGDCYASEIILYAPGTNLDGTPIPTNRVDGEQALGEPERTESFVFASLGYGEEAGFIILGFNGAVPNEDGDDLEIVETTFGSGGCASYPEFADVYVSQDGVEFFFAKTVCRFDGFIDISDAGDFDYITQVKIVNASESTTSDGFDVDGVVAIHNCTSSPDVTVDPGCTNETVIVSEPHNNNIVRLTAMGWNQGCDDQFGMRWRIRNETAAPVLVTYNFASAPAMQGPFALEAGEAVYFTSGFFATNDVARTMRIFVEGEQVNVKAHGGSTTDLADCLEGGCPTEETDTPSNSLGSFPNPSIGTATVVFVAGQSGKATLEVMDMSGRIVQTLLNQDVDAGVEYRTDFNGSNLPNGVYITRLSTGSGVTIDKMMIAK